MKRLVSVFLSVVLVLSTILITPFSASAASSYETLSTLSQVSISDWMSAIRGETKLTEITIPGTHDSCARKFSSNALTSSVVSSISKCQNLNITEQLNAGVRYLDVRCEVDKSTYSVKTVHGSTDCWNGNSYYYLDYVLQDVYDWLDAHPSETVLISIKEDDGDVGAPVFTEAIYQYIHGYGQNKYFYGEDYDYKSQWYLGKSVPTLDDVRGKCVLMNRFDQYISSSGSTVSEDESGQKVKWGDQGGSDYVIPVFSTYKNYNTDVGNFHVQDHYEWSTSNKLSATQDMLSLGHYRGEYYFNFTSTTTGASVPCPEDYAKTINAKFPSLTFNKSKPSGIIAMDFITSDLARTIVENNEAVSTIVQGTDGNISYTLNRLTGTLYVSGNGSMNDYEYTSERGVSGSGSTAPWGDQLTNSLFDGQYNTDLVKTIVIGEGITSIGNYAFYGFDNVTSVSIPSTVKSIGEGAFTKCSSLKTVDISKTAIQTIGDYAFKDCSSMNVFYTSNKVASISDNAFTNATSLVMYGSASIYSETYASENNIKYVVTGAYDEDTDWFTSKATYYEPFTSELNGEAVTNTAEANTNNSVSWVESYSGRSGVAFLPWSIDRTGQNYVNTSKSALNGESADDGVTISFFRQIGGNYDDGPALTLAKSDSSYFAIYDNGKIYYSNDSTSVSHTDKSSLSALKKWQYITVTVTKDKIKFYVNGEFDYSLDNTAGESLLEFLADDNTIVYPGSYISRGTSSLYLDEICVLSVAVDEQEVKAMYYSYNSPTINEDEIVSTDADIQIMSSNGYENVIYTHGTNPLTTSPLSMAADYMFKGDAIADGDNDGAYVYSTTAAGQENELSTTLTINNKYTIQYIKDQYENVIDFTKTSSTDSTTTYLLSGNLSNTYIDGSDDDLQLSISITDGTNSYEEIKFVHVTQHPVSANASAAIYRKWSNGNKKRDSALFMKAVGSTGISSAYYSGNYVFTSTPVYIGNGYGFASNTNADTLLTIGDGKQGDDLTDAYVNTSSVDIVNAGVYAQDNRSNGDQGTVTASGTTANYYVDLSIVSANSSIGGVKVGSDNDSFTIDTIVTRLAPMATGTTYKWSSSSISDGKLSWDTSLFTSDSAKSIGEYGTANNESSQVFGYIAPAISGKLSNGSQTATITAGLNHTSDSEYAAQDSIDINLVVYDKSELRNLVKSAESMNFTGKGVATEDWNNYITALSNAYANLNDYKDTEIITSSDSVYTNLASAIKAFEVDKTEYNSAISTVEKTISTDKYYESSSISNIAELINTEVINQTNYDIMTGKIYFNLRFLSELDDPGIDEINKAVAARTDNVKYDVDKINDIVNKYFDDISYSCNINGKDIKFMGYYNQESFDSLTAQCVEDIKNCYKTYKISTAAGNVVKSQNPFAGKDLSNGVTISFSKYNENDLGWDSSLINFSTGNNSDNRYFIIMANGSILFNDGNDGAGGSNGCYFDINSTSAVNSTSAKWVDIDLTIYKDSNNNHILKYYIDNELAATYNLSSICASGYPSGVSGNDGIFSFLSSDDINLYYGASFTNYGTMAGTTESYLDDVEFSDYAKSTLEISNTQSSLINDRLYYEDFTDSVGGTAVTGSADGGYNVYNQTTNNDGRSGTVYFPWSGTGASNTNYVNTSINPFANKDGSNGLTISFWQRINGSNYGKTESITFAQGNIGECKYFTIGTDGYIRYNNGDGGSDSNLSSSSLYFDYTTADSNIAKQTWQYITVEIVDDFHINYYVNGKLSKAITISGTSAYNSTGGLVDFLTNSNTTMYYGSYTPYWGTATLSLDDVSCYQGLLGDDSVKALYNMESSKTSACYSDSFDSSIPAKVSGSCKWCKQFNGKDGVLYIPSGSSNGSVSYYIDGVEVTDVSAVEYGTEVTVAYAGSGNVATWYSNVTNANGTTSDSSITDLYTFIVTGDTVIDFETMTNHATFDDVDDDALISAIKYSSKFSAEDYSSKSYDALVQNVKTYYSYVGGGYSQDDVDEATSIILSSIYDLIPYLTLNVTSDGGEFEYEYFDSEQNVSKQGVKDETAQLSFGTVVNLKATANEGYEFVGWYETKTSRLITTDLEYKFTLSSNTSVKALFRKTGSATLTFTNSSGWIAGTITKTIEEWEQYSSIDSLLPAVPYQVGYKNGKWDYNNDEVLAALKNGEDVKIYPTYEKGDSFDVEKPTSTDIPVGNLSYRFDEINSVASFKMALSVPDGVEVEEIGIAFYRGDPDTFDPTDYKLTLNNKNLVSKFNGYKKSGNYTVDITNFSSKYNVAAVGYATYYDEDGNLKVAYSNQINIVNTQLV
jgi:1-phosphatidylinositol phosphodiesterase